MNSFQLFSSLHSHEESIQKFIEQLHECATKSTHEKGVFLLRQGEKCTYSFFVQRGLLRQYHIDSKGKEHIVQFAPENWFMTDRESVYFNQPSRYFIQALEYTETLQFDEALLLQLSRENPSFVALNTRLLHNHIRHLQQRITQLQSATAKERYLDFIGLYPDLLLRVPQILIASYLGITPESLSRVRKEMARKNQAV